MSGLACRAQNEAASSVEGFQKDAFRNHCFANHLYGAAPNVGIPFSIMFSSQVDFRPGNATSLALGYCHHLTIPSTC